jgi:hypothetical protein
MALTQVPGSMINGAGNASVSGITFPATQVPSADANTLDDYEEGTWTPTLTPEVSGSISLSTATGRYTKIGNRVTVNCFVVTSSVSSPTGEHVRVGGLPFAAATGQSYWGSGSCRYNGLNASLGGKPMVMFIGSNNDIRLEAQNGGGLLGNFASYFVGSADIEITFTYIPA